jgi:hypothetical protein
MSIGATIWPVDERLVEERLIDERLADEKKAGPKGARLEVLAT